MAYPPGGAAVTVDSVRHFAVFKGGQKVESGLVWSAQHGAITADGTYTAPAATGKDRVEARFQDGSGWWLAQDLDVVAPPSIQALSANPPRVAAGGLSHLTATFTTDFLGSLRQGSSTLQWSSTSFGVDVHPTATTTYSLVVQNRAGDQVQQTVTVETF